MSTVFGSIIFVCIVMTCIIPLWFSKQQADLMYDKAVAEARQSDIDRASEDLSLSTTDSTVYLKNTGSISINIVRVWLNETHEEESLTLPIFGQGELDFPDLNGTYNVIVTTDRGRIFTTELNNYISPEPEPLTMWTAPRIEHYITITENETINPPGSIIPYVPELDQFAAIFETTQYELQLFTGTLAEYYEGYLTSWFIDSCTLVHLEGDIPNDLAIWAEITVLKDGEAILIPWSFEGTFVSYRRDSGGLHITPFEIYTQYGDESIPVKDHYIDVPTIPSYQSPLENVTGEPNAIIIEFDFSSIVDVGVYSIDISLNIMGRDNGES